MLLRFTLLAALVLLAVAGCSNLVSPRTPGDRDWLSRQSLWENRLSEESLVLNASAHLPHVTEGRIILDNDTALEEKLALIRGATRNIELAYYIFEDDYSSSLVAAELVAAAQRGVRVRMLLDYFSNYVRLDFFRAMERAAAEGGGHLDIRFYGRPTDRIIADALYMTLNCAELGRAGDMQGCAAAKKEEVARRMENARGDLPPGVPGNYNSGASGTLLSALYAKKPGQVASSVINAQEIDLSAFKSASPGSQSPEEKAKKFKAGLEAARRFNAIYKLL